MSSISVAHFFKQCVVDDTPIQTGKVVPDEPLELDFQVVQAFPSFENLKDRQLHFSTEHGAWHP